MLVQKRLGENPTPTFALWGMIWGETPPFWDLYHPPPEEIGFARRALKNRKKIKRGGGALLVHAPRCACQRAPNAQGMRFRLKR